MEYCSKIHTTNIQIHMVTVDASVVTLPTYKYTRWQWMHLLLSS